MHLFDSPTEYVSTDYENISATVLFCKEMLERNGYGTEASTLAGLEVINSPVVACLVYRALKNMYPVSGDAKKFVDISKRLLEDLLLEKLEALHKPS